MATQNDSFSNFLVAAGGISSPEQLLKAQTATKAEAAARADALRQNSALLRFDATQFQTVGQEVYQTEYRKNLQRTASTASDYIGSGVKLEGSASDVTRSDSREGMREAENRRNEYVYQARRALKEADIFDYRASLETMAGDFEAQSIQENARSQFEAARARYIGSGKSAAQRAASVHPWSLQAGAAANTIYQYTQTANAVNPFATGDQNKAAKKSVASMLGDIGGYSRFYQE